MSPPPTATPRIGTWLSLGSPAVAELASDCGFDWLLFDLEHGCESEAALPAQLRALRGSPTTAIVRVGAPHPDLVARALDWGAGGIMIPRIESAPAAEQCVRAAHYAPRGRRGFARTTRAHGYGLRVPSDNPFVPTLLAQIETIAGLDHADAIAAVDGIDALFVGPADLTFDLRAHGSSRTHEDCLKSVLAAASRHGKSAGILVRTSEDLARMRALGFTWLAVDSDLSLLREGFLRHLRDARTPPA